MSLYRKVRAVERLFDRLAKEETAFLRQQPLTCLPGCGRCCTYPDIAATPLEFLPLAYHALVDGTIEQLYQSVEGDQKECVNFRPSGPFGKGSCGHYTGRGLICRLFGYAARTDKTGQNQLIACKTMKDETPDQVQKVNEYLLQGGTMPVAASYYRALSAIDSSIGGEMIPINQAIRQAIEIVLAYYAYRPKPRPRKKAA
jgi:uncharacterized protein